MNKIKSTLLLVLIVATTTITTLADGQIPIGGRPESEPTKTTTATIVTTTEPNNEIAFEISNYLLTLAGIVGQFKF